MRPEWFPDWSGEVCAIVASGPSAKSENVESLRGRCRIAVVNNSHELAPWADLLYAADHNWWDEHHAAVRSFAGLKVIPTGRNVEQSDERRVAATAKRYGLRLVTLCDSPKNDKDPAAHRFSFEDGMIARGGNSAHQLANLVTQFRCKRQIWLGFDFTGDHWHGTHRAPLRNPRPRTLEKWAMRLDSNAGMLADRGVEIINGSDISLLTAYPKMSLAAAMAKWG